jgi:hypothetical protein
MSNDGDGDFVNPVTSMDDRIEPSYITSHDVNLDGHLDLIMFQYHGVVTIRLGAGDGTFASTVSYGTGSYAEDAAFGDFDADGDLDIVTANVQDKNISLLRNRACDLPVTCPADIAPPGGGPGGGGGDGVVNIDDLLEVINNWGQTEPPGSNPADAAPPGGDGIVNIDDLLLLINNWGPCG